MFQVFRTNRMRKIKYLNSRYYNWHLIVLFLRLLLLKIKKVLLILNSQAILIFMIKSIQQNQNTKKISKLEIQQVISLIINIKKLKILKINNLIMIFYCKIIMIFQIMSFLMKKRKKYNIATLLDIKKVFKDSLIKIN